MEHAIVTGAAGFIGANIVRRLLEDGVEPHLFIAPGSARWRLAELEDHAPIVEVDVADHDGVATAVAKARADRVYHLAAHGGYSWQTDHQAILRANILGTSNMLEASLAQGFEVFVNTGSSSEYGLKDHAPTEDEVVNPNSTYAVAKVAATMLCRQVAVRSGANVCTLRLYSTYGPWEEPRRLVPALAVEGLRGRLPPLVDSTIARDFVWVGDVVDAYLAAGHATHDEPGAIYNVGTGVQTTIAEAVEVTRDVLAVEARPQWGSMPARAWDTSRWIADSSKIRDRLGWQATLDFRAGLAAYAHWLRERPEVLSYYEAQRA
ncbi:MAG: SDR family NAD(P)-dependent oxidoreductase [Thermoleophilia bacterium]|nr:SDR family NAD(P)-dependent oxidoreductase [Thermoleophilia bacterium]